MKDALTPAQTTALLSILESRFKQHMHRHEGLEWAAVRAKLETNAAKLQSLHLMEETGGEPDVVGLDAATGEFLFYDCAAESPKGRRSYCYDRAAWESRKENKPADNAVDTAAAMGITLLNEAEYRSLQQLEPFDQKTSSWIKTPEEIRKLGGALFCVRRVSTVFTYHNGAESYYAARGFRACLRV